MQKKIAHILIIYSVVLTAILTVCFLFMSWSGLWPHKAALSVVTRSLKTEDAEEGNKYWTIWENRRTGEIAHSFFNHKKETEAFTPEITEYFDFKNGPHNSIMYATDENGNSVKADESLIKACAVAKTTIPHDIMQIRAFRSGDSWYLVVKLNVNWWDPCELYRYDCSTEALTYMAQWDDVDVIGITLKIPARQTAEAGFSSL